MEKMNMRVLLLVAMGAFLLMAGVFMDGMGRQISTNGRTSLGLPFSGLVLVGRIVIAVGAAMLVSAIYVVLRVRFRKKDRSAYERASTNPVPPAVESPPYSHFECHLRQETPSRHLMPSQLPDNVPYMRYSPSLSAQNLAYSQGFQIDEGQPIISPSAPMMLSQYSSSTGFRNPRYSETSEASERTMTPITTESPTMALIHNYPVQPGTRTSYPSRETVSRYQTSSMAHTLQPAAHRQKDRPMKDQRRPSPTVTNLDEPPPYESTDIPPPYYP